jgi:sugar/nucleoside kinase (ribokinase family)
MAWRLHHGVEESVKFAAALTSIKMERPGPFSGTIDDVLARMKTL